MRDILEALAPYVPVASVIPWGVAVLLWRALEKEREDGRKERAELAKQRDDEREQRIAILREALTTMATQTEAVERLGEATRSLTDQIMQMLTRNRR